MNSLRSISLSMSGVLGFLATTVFAWTLYTWSIPQNIASWLMVLSLEIVGLASVYKDGNKQPYLQIGWTLAALSVVLAILFGNNSWQWGQMESMSLLFCGIALVVYFAVSARVAICVYMIAMYVSLAPLMVDYWYEPQINTLWFWFANITACAFAIYGAPKRDFANTFIPWASILQNAFIVILCIK